MGQMILNKVIKGTIFQIKSITGILFSIMDSGVAQKMEQTLDPLEKQKTVKMAISLNFFFANDAKLS